MKESEQTSPNLTSPNQRTAPKTAECVLRLGTCPDQLDYGRVPGFERFPVVCGKRGMSRQWRPDTGIEYEGVQCLYSVLHY